jgi:propionyl-CoA carboxylase beta chain
MVEKTGYMFITGPEIVKAVTRETVTKEALGGAMAHNATSGVAHFTEPDDATCLERIRELLGFLPQNNMEAPPRIAPTDDPERRDEALRDRVPADPNKPYDIRDLVRSNLDDGYLFEVQALYAQNIVVGFGRLDGATVGIVANQPISIHVSTDARGFTGHADD